MLAAPSILEKDLMPISASIANMPEDKKQAWRKKLSITSAGRKMSHESIAKALATRKTNLVMKNLLIVRES